MAFHDHFSSLAGTYAVYRPVYPDALFELLARHAPATDAAWDAGCGSGQASVGLAAHFARVEATDPSAAQVAEATPHPRVHYGVTPAERSGLPPHGVDLVLAAEAAHWFDVPAFEAEVRRVARPGGLLAIVGYRLLEVDAAVDAAVGWYAYERVGPWWPPERALLDAGYATLPVTLPEERPEPVTMTAAWSLHHLLGYLGTWSSTKRCREATGIDPIPEAADRLAAAWGAEADTVRTVRWPLLQRWFRVP